MVYDLSQNVLDKAKATSFERLYEWLKREYAAYECGEMMSLSESVHGATVTKEILKKMDDLFSEECDKMQKY